MKNADDTEALVSMLFQLAVLCVFTGDHDQPANRRRAGVDQLTIGSHVQHILAKFAFTSRRDRLLVRLAPVSVWWWVRAVGVFR